MKISIIKSIIKGEKVSVQLRASFWFFVYSLLSTGVSILMTPVFTRVMTQEAYGLINVYNTWSGLLSTFLTLSIAANALINGLIKYEDDQNGFISSMIALTAILIGGGFAVFLIFHNIIIQKSGLDIRFWILMFVKLFLNACWGFWAVFQRFQYKYKLLTILNVITLLLAEVLGYVAVKMYPSEQAFAKLFIASIPTILIQIVCVWSMVKKGKILYEKEYWKYAIFFCLPLLPYYLSSLVLAQSDKLMINYIEGTSKTAIYSVAYTIGEGVHVLWNAIYATLLPWTYQSLKQNKTSDIRRVSNSVFLILGLICIFISLFSPEIMLILAPASYGMGIFVIPPVAIATYMTFVYTMYSKIQLYYERNKIVAFFSVLAAALNLLLNWIFIPIFGFVAAAYTTLASYFAIMILNLFDLKKQGHDKVYNNKFIVSITLCMIVLSVFVSLTFQYSTIRYIVIGLFIVGLFFGRRKIIHVMKEIKYFRG